MDYLKKTLSASVRKYQILYDNFEPSQRLTTLEGATTRC